MENAQFAFCVWGSPQVWTKWPSGKTDAFLGSDLAAPFQSEDNSSIASSAAIKKTILALARDVESVPRDGFALAVPDHFQSHYENVTSCEVELREKLWTRLAPDGRPHPFFFVREEIGTPFSKVRREQGKTVQRSAGIRGITMMKTAEHGLRAFREPEFASRTQPIDGVLATSLDAEWEYSADSDDLEACCYRVDAESLQRNLRLLCTARVVSNG